MALNATRLPFRRSRLRLSRALAAIVVLPHVGAHRFIGIFLTALAIVLLTPTVAIRVGNCLEQAPKNGRLIPIQIAGNEFKIGLTDVPSVHNAGAGYGNVIPISQLQGFVADGTPTVNLQDFQQGQSSNGPDGGGPDPSVIDEPTVFEDDVSDTLLSINAATAFGEQDTLIGTNGSDSLTAYGEQDTLIAENGNESLTLSGFEETAIAINGGSVLTDSALYGDNNTLIGDAQGSTLIGSTATVAAYALNNVTVELDGSGSGTATVNGGSVSDTLENITTVIALGSSDTLTSSGGTLIASGSGDTLINNGSATFYSDAQGNTLIDALTVVYNMNDVTVDLATGKASITGSNLADTLVGISAAEVLGSSDTTIAGNGTNLLTALDSGGQGDVLIGNCQNDTLLSGTPVAIANTLIGGDGTDTLISNGEQDSLIAGTGPNMLLASGYDNTLFGNAAGSTLDGTYVYYGDTSGGYQSENTEYANEAAYALDNVVVDLLTGMAGLNGSSVIEVGYRFFPHWFAGMANGSQEPCND